MPALAPLAPNTVGIRLADPPDLPVPSRVARIDGSIGLIILGIEYADH
jgi:hypothetical protein